MIPHAITCHTVVSAVDKVVGSDVTIDLIPATKEVSTFHKGVHGIHLEVDASRSVEHDFIRKLRLGRWIEKLGVTTEQSRR